MLQSRREVERVAILLALSQETCETCKGKGSFRRLDSNSPDALTPAEQCTYCEGFGAVWFGEPPTRGIPRPFNQQMTGNQVLALAKEKGLL